MEWIVLSLLSAVSFSAYTLLQKYIFQRQISSFVPFSFWGALLHLGIAIAILIVRPIPLSWMSLPIFVVLGMGVLNTASTLLVNRVIQREEEISRVVPIVDTYPVFVAILAVLFLGESLTPLKWLAMGLVMTGAFLASWHQGLPGSRVKMNASFMLLLTASVGIAVYCIATKYALGHLDFWHVYALSWIGSAPAYVLVTHLLHAWKEVRLAGRSTRSLMLTWSTHTLLFLAFVTSVMAFSVGPVSLSSAIMASRPVLVLLYTTLVAVLVPKVLSTRISRRALLENGLSASLVTLGVGAMAFL